MESDYQKGDAFVKKVLIATSVIFTCLLYRNPEGIRALIYLIGLACCINCMEYRRRRILRILWRDLRCLVRLLRIGKYLYRMQKNEETIPKVFNKNLERFPDKIMLRFEDQVWTYKQVEAFSNKVANYFWKKGVRKGDNVALLMETRIQYAPFWLGLQKIGAATSLINHNLSGDQLIHSLTVLPIKAVIYGSEIEKALKEVQRSLQNITLYFFGEEVNPTIKEAINLRLELENETDTKPAKVECGIKDTALYIFTSGTTGMPKAVILTHGRYISMVMASFFYLRLQDSDNVYVSLPLYHTNGGILGTGQAICAGVTVTLRKKFSASNFWKDCIHHNCTAAIYIGEICRYLLAAPPSPWDKQHSIRLMFGNGLRSSIWENFVNRFGIKSVAEIYGSTEGIGPLTNTEGVVGAVGHIPLIWKSLIPIYLVKMDPETEMPARDANGRCIKITKPNEPGMHISKIVTNHVGQEFKGYSNPTATSKKIIKDVFEEGDKYFVSGDVFTVDEDLFVYFQDRTGDTFRWRGENVSTTEVEQIIMDIIGLRDAAVYGVEIPGNEGKAGMAAIVGELNENELKEFHQAIKKKLAKYARPIFLRFLTQIKLTSTYKIMKKQLKEDGYNPLKTNDKIFYYSSKNDQYLPLTAEVYDKITLGQIVF